METETKSNAFGEAVAEIMGRRGIHFDRASVRGLAERSGVEDVETFTARVFGETSEHPGPLDGLADELALNREECERLAWAFTFGEDMREL